jgi:hypothetical protein
MAVEYIGSGAPDGICLGLSSSEKLAFFGTAPSVKATGFTAPAATAATSSTPFGFSEAQANALITWARAVDAELKAKGLIGS